MTLRIVHTPAEGTVMEGTRRGDGTIAALRAAGLGRWRWPRQVGGHGAWYLPGTRDQVPPSELITRSADVLRAAGFEVATEIDTRARAMPTRRLRGLAPPRPGSGGRPRAGCPGARPPVRRRRPGH